MAEVRICGCGHEFADLHEQHEHEDFEAIKNQHVLIRVLFLIINTVFWAFITIALLWASAWGMKGIPWSCILLICGSVFALFMTYTPMNASQKKLTVIPSISVMFIVFLFSYRTVSGFLQFTVLLIIYGAIWYFSIPTLIVQDSRRSSLSPKE